MNLETVNYQHDGSVAIIKLNRPQAGNALSAQLASDLLAAASGAAKDDNVRAVVFSAEGDYFCFGGDLKEFKAFGGQHVDFPDNAETRDRRGQWYGCGRRRADVSGWRHHHCR